MASSIEREPQEFLYHYSENPDITRFTPHVPVSNPEVVPAVWAIDAARAPVYWFPRDCPRIAVWAESEDQQGRMHDRFDTDATRLQVTLAEWEAPMTSCELFEYRFDPQDFVPLAEAEGQWIATIAQEPVGVEPAGSLVERQRSAGVDLRFVDEFAELADLRLMVVSSGLPFSIVRYRPTHPLRSEPR